MPPLNPMQLSVISDEYYFKGFVLGRDRLYEHMVQTYNINFGWGGTPNMFDSRDQVEEWLKYQHVNTIHQRQRKPKSIDHFRPVRPLHSISIDLIDYTKNNFLWVTDFPLVEYSAEEGRYFAMHHPFTSPKDEDVEKMSTDPLSIRARAYDLVLNGSEIGGGSIRIHNRDIQSKMFELLGIGEEEAQEKRKKLIKKGRFLNLPFFILHI